MNWTPLAAHSSSSPAALRAARLLLAPVVMGLLLCAAACAVDSTPSRPNIIFILLDDQGWADAGAFGHPYMKTPHIDQLVSQSARFEQF